MRIMAEPRLAQRISDAIASGAYRPGEWLKQIDIAATFDATRFEVRRALEELTLRNTVSHVPQKGYRVSVPDESDLGYLRQVRVILEAAAGRLVTSRIDETGIAKLEELSARFHDAIENGTPAERNAANHSFHDTMYAFAGNPRLSDLIVEIRDRFRGTPIYSWPSVQSMRQSGRDHDDIVAALRKRDADSVVRAIERHILKPSD
jgi:DNA-binding GntR family transcriptional regulator